MQKPDISPALFAGFEADPEKTVFFDIETTGFSAQSAFIYLICAGFLDNGVPTLIQWFAETPDDEPKVISAFLEFIKPADTLVHFNGKTFDVPFTSKRAETLGISCDFSVFRHFDLMVLLRPFKETLGLKGLRQKDVEAFLHIDRDDIYTGGELIEVYKQYLGRSRYDRLTSGTPLSFAPGSGLPTMPRSQSEALLSLLLLHNAEDVEGLIRLSCLMPLINLLSGAKVPGRTNLSFEDDALFVSFPGITELPCEIKCDTLFAGPESITLQMPYYTGTLKHFFPDHKNYYYLPATDSVIHKSAGMGLPKETRQNAKPGNCYVKKAGTFLPFCPEGCMEFKTDLKDKIVYSEVSDVKKLAENDILKAVFPNRSQNGI